MKRADLPQAPARERAPDLHAAAVTANEEPVAPGEELQIHGPALEAAEPRGGAVPPERRHAAQRAGHLHRAGGVAQHPTEELGRERGDTGNGALVPHVGPAGARPLGGGGRSAAEGAFQGGAREPLKVLGACWGPTLREGPDAFDEEIVGQIRALVPNRVHSGTRLHRPRRFGGTTRPHTWSSPRGRNLLGVNSGLLL